MKATDSRVRRHAQMGADMKEVLLSGEKLTKNFGENRVLQGVDITVYEGDFTVVMGSSGSGKSTLLYALSGMDAVSGGKLSYRGRDITGLSEREFTGLRAGDFGFVFQRMHLVSTLSLYENIVIAGYIGSRGTEQEVRLRADSLVERMNLSGVKNRLPSEVSGGEAQRAAIARAVIAQPRILFADEPTGALNKANTQEVLNLFTALNREGQSVLLVTHDREAALRGSRILYLEDGMVVGELELSCYEGKDRGREDSLNEWLEERGW